MVPDNVLFESGAGGTLRKRLLKEFEVHIPPSPPHRDLLRIRRRGQRLFFDKRPAGSDPWTEKLWVYDFRTNQQFT